jgi:NAD-dependent deacetylase
MQTVLNNDEAIARIAQTLARSRSILFITGAGISADSGLPTYRGIGGLYNVNTTEDGMPIERALSGEIIDEQPELTWKYLSQIEKNCRGAQPNRGHEVIAEMQEHFDRLWVLTQNVDGLHKVAGARNVIDIHGDLHQLVCMHCPYRCAVEDYSDLSFPPRCPDCEGILRPDVILFGELLSERKVEQLFTEMKRGFDVVFSVGTTSVFPYIAEPVRFAAQLRSATIEINPDVSRVTHLVDIKLAMRATPALEAIWQCFLESKA